MQGVSSYGQIPLASEFYHHISVAVVQFAEALVDVVVDGALDDDVADLQELHERLLQHEIEHERFPKLVCSLEEYAHAWVPQVVLS